MGKAIQIIRGTTAENNNYIGALGSLSYDTDSKDLRLHDGVTLGGITIPTLVAVQRPTQANNYTWYRKYSDGWVEQGGVGTSQAYNVTNQNVTFPITMKDTKYQALLTAGESTQASWDFGVRVAIRYTNGMDVRGGTNGNYAYTGPFFWQVCGMAAAPDGGNGVPEVE